MATDEEWKKLSRSMVQLGCSATLVTMSNGVRTKIGNIKNIKIQRNTNIVLSAIGQYSKRRNRYLVMGIFMGVAHGYVRSAIKISFKSHN